MPDINDASRTLGEAFRKKTTSFLLIGVFLMIASMYFNTIKQGVGDVGIIYSQTIILIVLGYQVLSWILYLAKKYRKPPS